MENCEIGLIIWGCKGGYRVFCSNNVVDYGSSIIKDTIKDIRPFIRFVQNSLNIYALEFTKIYKIYTLYRSCRDSGNGAYVAITIYVPHTLQVDNVRDILYQMMDSYFSEYVDPYGNFFPGKYDDIRPFTSMLQKMANPVGIEKKFNVRRSDQDDIPKLWIYEDIKEVENFYISPYRQEFYRCQEVMFIASDLYNQMPNTFDILKETKIIQKVSEQESLPELKLSDYVNNIKSFKINNEFCDISKPIQICDSDEIVLEFVRPYCEIETIEGDVAKLKNQEFLYAKGNMFFLNVDKIPTTYKKYTFKVRLNGAYAPDNKIKVSFDRRNWEDIKSSNFSVTGKDLKSKLYWSIPPFPGAKYIYSSKPVDLVACIGSANIIDLESDIFNYQINVGDVKNPSLRIIVENISMDFSLKCNKKSIIQFELPKNFSSEELFKFGTNDYAIVNVNNHIVDISPKSFVYNIKLPYIELSEVDWDFSVNAESRKRKDGKIELNPNENVHNGFLTIDGYRFTFAVNDNNDILPQGVVIIPPTDLGVGISYREKDLVKFQNFILPSLPIFVDSDKLSFTESSENGIIIVRVTPIKTYDINNEESEHGNKLNVSFINCKGFQIVGDGQVYGELEKNDSRDLKTLDSIRIVKNNYECIILKDSNEYKRNPQIDTANKQNGFVVTYSGDGLSCSVSFKKGSGVLKFIPRFVGITLSIVLAVIISIGAYFVFFKDSTYDAIYVSVLVDDTKEIPQLQRIDGIISEEVKVISTKDASHVVVVFDGNLYEKLDNNLRAYADSICNVSLTLKWGNEEYTEKCDLEEYQEKIENELKKFIKDENKETRMINVKVTPKIITILRNFSTDNSSDNIIYQQAINLAGAYPIAIPFLKTFCWEKVNKSNKDSLATYKDVLRGTQLYYTKADSLIGIIIHQDKVAQEQKNREIQAEKQINKLKQLNCTMQTVEEVENWWNSQDKTLYKGVNMDNYIVAYKKFFNATSVNDMNILHNQYRRYFTPKQHNVIFIGYGNPDNYSQWKKTFGMSFSKPYEVGLIK